MHGCLSVALYCILYVIFTAVLSIVYLQLSLVFMDGMLNGTRYYASENNESIEGGGFTGQFVFIDSVTFAACLARLFMPWQVMAILNNKMKVE